MVFDTMVLAYSLLGVEEFRDEATLAIASSNEIWAPDSIWAELVHVVWQWIRHREVAVETGLEVLRDADRLITQVVPAHLLWASALELAVERSHPAYDTLFVALAAGRASRVVTYDGKLKKSFPEYVSTVPEFLASKRLQG